MFAIEKGVQFYFGHFGQLDTYRYNANIYYQSITGLIYPKIGQCPKRLDTSTLPAHLHEQIPRENSRGFERRPKEA
jgi:hypothetical protein